MKIVGVSSIEDTFYIEEIGKWLIITSKASKEQTKREVNKILVSVCSKIIHPEYKNSLEKISKVNRNPTLSSYASVLQREAEFGPEVQNLQTRKRLNRNVVIIYDTHNKQDLQLL